MPTNNIPTAPPAIVQEGEIQTAPDGTRFQILTRADGKKVRRTFKKKLVPVSPTSKENRKERQTAGQTTKPEPSLEKDQTKNKQANLNDRSTQKLSVKISTTGNESEVQQLSVQDLLDLLGSMDLMNVLVNVLVGTTDATGTTTNVSVTDSCKAPQEESKQSEAKEEEGEEGNATVGQLQKQLKSALFKKDRYAEQLRQAGIPPAEDVPYQDAVDGIANASARLMEIGSHDVKHPDPMEQAKLRKEYHELTLQVERLDSALVLTEEYQTEQRQKEEEWESKHAAGNEEAIRKLRRHMPVNIRTMTTEEVMTAPTPNGKTIPKTLARKFKRTNVLKLIRMHPNEIEKSHPVFLTALGVMGMTLTERRAVHHQLRKAAPEWYRNRTEANCKRRWQWYEELRANLKTTLEDYEQHVEQYGPPENHSCSLIGFQCPCKADQKMDYSGDYGFPAEEEYILSPIAKVTDDPGARAQEEAQALVNDKASKERSVALKKHYKSLLAVTKATGSCAAMDEAMDTIEKRQQEWVQTMVEKGDYSNEEKRKEIIGYTQLLNYLKKKVFDLAERTGIQTGGAKKNAGVAPDTRGAIECGLSEELRYWMETLFTFLERRMATMKVADARVTQIIAVIRDIMQEIHARNVTVLEKFGYPKPSRKLKTIGDMEREARCALLPGSSNDETSAVSRGIPPPSAPKGLLGQIAKPDTGGFLAAISGRKKDAEETHRTGRPCPSPIHNRSRSRSIGMSNPLLAAITSKRT